MTRTDSVVRARHRSLPRRYPPGLRLNSPDRVFVFVDYWRLTCLGYPPSRGVSASSSMSESASWRKRSRPGNCRCGIWGDSPVTPTRTRPWILTIRHDGVTLSMSDRVRDERAGAGAWDSTSAHKPTSPTRSADRPRSRRPRPVDPMTPRRFRPRLRWTKGASDCELGLESRDGKNVATRGCEASTPWVARQTWDSSCGSSQ
jgi:hypothetical protein